MPETTPPTLADLAASMAELQRQMDLASLTALTSIQEVLNRPALTEAIADLQALIPQLPESIELRAPRNQAGNVVKVLEGVRGLFDAEVARVSALVPVDAPDAPL